MEEKASEQNLIDAINQGKLTEQQLVEVTKQSDFPLARENAKAYLKYLARIKAERVAQQLLKNEEILKTENKKIAEKLKDIRSTTTKHKHELETMVQESQEGFIPLGSKYLCLEKVKKNATSISIEAAKIIYSQFRTNLNPEYPPNMEEVEAFGQMLEMAQQTLEGDKAKFVRKSTKPISVLLGVNKARQE